MAGPKFSEPVEITNQILDAAKVTVQFDGGGVTRHSSISMGSSGIDANTRRFLVDGWTADMCLGGNGSDGDLLVFGSGAEDIRINSTAKAAVWLASKNGSGKVILRNTIQLLPRPKVIDSITLDAKGGHVVIRDGKGVAAFGIHASTSDNNPTAGLWIGSLKSVDGVEDKAGSVTIRGNTGSDSIILDGNGSWMGLQDKLANRAFAVYSEGMTWNDNSVAFLAVGKHKNDEPKPGRKSGVVVVRNPQGDDSIVLDGTKGDIILANADCAEEFEVSTSSVTEPGTVMVFTKDGSVTESDTAYDKKVAGVISGGGNYKPGIVLDRRTSKDKRVPVALMGKVYCKVDAEYSEIEVGDLLTTSSHPGHAMKAADPLKAFGAIIGKSLASLSEGRRLLPILVSLQ